MTSSKINFSEILGTQGDLKAFDWNGPRLSVSISSSGQYINSDNMWVQDANGGISVTLTAAYAIYIAQGRPTVPTTVSESHMTAAKDRISDVFSVAKVLQAAKMLRPIVDAPIPAMGASTADILASGKFVQQGVLKELGNPLKVYIRSSDLLSKGEISNLMKAQDGTLNAIADVPAPDSLLANCYKAFLQLESYLMARPAEFGRYNSEYNFAIMLMCANQHHRESHNGHNGYTQGLSDKSSPQSKLAAMAEAMREDFHAYMSKHNRFHDLWHFLSEETMHAIVYAFIGKNEDGEPCMLASGTEYSGGLLEGHTHISDLINVGTGVKDRLPAGTPGISSLVIGVQMVIALTTSLSSKVRIMQAEGVLHQFSELKNHLTSNKITREQQLALKNRMQAICSLSYAYLNADPTTRGMANQHLAFVKYAEHDGPAIAAGASLYNAISELDSSPAGMSDQISSVFSSMASIVNAAGDFISGIETVDVNGLAISVPLTSAQQDLEIKKANLKIELAKAGVGADDDDNKSVIGLRVNQPRLTANNISLAARAPTANRTTFGAGFARIAPPRIIEAPALSGTQFPPPPDPVLMAQRLPPVAPVAPMRLDPLLEDSAAGAAEGQAM